MTKTQVRLLKSHYLSRWTVMRHNQKNKEKLLALNDQFVLANLMSGDTLCYNCLGEMYQGIIPNLSTLANKKYNNIVLINNMEFKYKTIDQLVDLINNIARQYLLANGRLIMSLEHRYLIYDRVDVSVDTLLKTLINSLKKFTPVAKLNLLRRSQPGYGDYFLCLNYNE